MIAYIAAKLTRWFHKYVPMTDSDVEVYQYAFDIALYTLLSTMGLLSIGGVIGYLNPTIICIALFYLNQSFGGGYHANSHIGCFMTMALGLLIYLLLLSFQPKLEICYIVVTFSFGILMVKPLVLHKNKQYLTYNRKKLIIRSRIIVLIEMIGFCLLLRYDNALFLISVSFSLLLCAVSRITAWLLSMRHP